uniref:glucuronosyltransferase n=2 Tax=Cyprinus carpio TaxID=7962 RepID=A0A8C2CU31_CYPCA
MVRALTVHALGILAFLCLFSSEPVRAGKVLVAPVDGSHWLSMKILVEELSRRGHEMVVLVPETSVLIGKSEPVRAGKVLVAPVDGSHWLSMKILVEELSRRGHEMVVLVPETSVLIGKSDNYTTKSFRVPYTLADLKANLDNIEKNAFEKPPNLSDIVENVGNLIQFLNMQVKACEWLLYDETLMKSLRETGFDVVLTDPFLPCGTIIADSFLIPAVYFLRLIPCLLDEGATQCPSPPSFVPRFFTGFSDKMTFPQRVRNMLMTIFEAFLCRKLFAGTDELASRYLQKDTTYKELLSHGAVWLFRYDFTFEFPKPQMPNMVQIGGINCAKKGPLTKELEEFVNGSGEHGFVVFTLGSMVSQLPEAKARVFFEAFRQIPQRVLWRYTGPIPENAPKNVKLMKWLPQNDLLGHPKVKAFITHGGSHGIYEGIFNGVPMVMLPLFGDQGDNVQRLVSRGVAETLSIYDLTSEKLLVALRKVINDKSYKEKMTELSAIHRDRPIEPLDLAVFWTEFVMRHKGAAHLRPAAHELNWIQYHSLDVIGFLILILVTVIFVTVKSCMFCFKKCFKKTQKKKKE